MKLNAATEVTEHAFGTVYFYPDGNRAIYLTAALNDGVAAEISARKINRLIVGRYRPWRPGAGASLADRIDQVWIQDCEAPNELILDFPLARSIHLDRPAEGIDFSIFGDLRECALAHQIVIPRSLSLCPRLISLALAECQLRDLDLRGFGSLRKLCLGSVRVPSLGAIRELVELRHFGVARLQTVDLEFLACCTHLEWCSLSLMPRLASLAGMEKCRRLRHLDVGGCGRLSDISALGDAWELRDLMFEGCPKIASLKPLLALTNLEDVRLWEHTKIADGAIRALLAIPSLRLLHFQNRKHYDLTAAEADRAFAGRLSNREVQPTDGSSY
ncbi:MAG: hypothetical protein IPL39_16865 [Opitutaceae bacterium]|nr:hypothetical protein [Opitutaceae bacterium]